MSQHTQTDNPNIYLERSGKGSLEITERLLANPVEPLSEDEKQEVLAFESDIADFRLTDEVTIEGSLRTHKVEDYPFFADAFLKGEVEVEGLEEQLSQLHTPEDVYSWLALSIKNKSVSLDNLRKISRDSATYYKNEMAQAILMHEKPAETISNMQSFVVDTDRALDSVHLVAAARAHLIELRKQYPRNATGVDGAKRAMIDIYLKRVNGAVSSDITGMQDLLDQSELIGDEETIDAAISAMPEGLQAASTDPEIRSSLNRRLDYIRNGIGYDENGKATAVDMSVFNTTNSEQKVGNTESLFSPEQREKLRNFMVSPEQMMSVFEEIIGGVGLLSAEDPSTWFEGRGHRAEDKLFQVVRQPVKDTFLTDGIEGVLRSPNAPRSLYDLITVGIHELSHISQSESDRVFAEKLRIGALKGRRVGMIRETGANIVQRQAEQELFGEQKPVAMTYARAIQALEAGGGLYEASQAFFNEKDMLFPGNDGLANAKEAADRVLRLVIHGGVNSQPMSYAEENIMHHELEGASAEVKRRATLLTTLDLDDQDRLHKYGLLPTPEGGEVDWMAELMKVVRPLIEEALKT